jgi:hypothetical protein
MVRPKIALHFPNREVARKIETLTLLAWHADNLK